MVGSTNTILHLDEADAYAHAAIVSADRSLGHHLHRELTTDGARVGCLSFEAGYGPRGAKFPAATVLGHHVKAMPPPGFADVAELVPGVVIDMRYATARNFTGAPLPG